jgi:MFS family permease
VLVKLRSLVPINLSSSQFYLLELSLELSSPVSIVDVRRLYTVNGRLGDISEMIGRRFTIIIGCIIYTVGVILQVASSSLALLVVGRLIAGLGVGFESAIVILYMSEICPRKVRGALVAGYQFAITIGEHTSRKSCCFGH